MHKRTSFILAVAAALAAFVAIAPGCGGGYGTPPSGSGGGPYASPTPMHT